MNDLRGKRVAIIVTDGFEQIEMTSRSQRLPVFNREMVSLFKQAAVGVRA